MSIFRKLFGKNIEEETKPKCPNCEKILDAIPLKKKKCPYCSKYILIRTSPQNGNKLLVSEETAELIDLEWEKISSRKNWLEKLKRFGITENNFNKRKELFSNKIGKEANDRDVFWSLFNELLANTKNTDSLKDIYYEMALFENEEGRNSYELLLQSRRMELMSYQNTKIVKKVKILATNDSCEECKENENKIFTIEEALDINPIPCKKCTYKLYDENNGFCRCIYIAEIERR